jgi:hemerythrin-like domain-containing protein
MTVTAKCLNALRIPAATARKRLEHHMDEEENEIFAAAKKELSEERANELAKIFDNRKPVEKREVA